ncbi:MAG: hypothetical protein LBD57_03195 [Endomicrobium sp.]|jgi:hypothetical protein|uniref:hypothetical protein n=1 Tax=Candidatus Endomicrobiellum cubanum TaxID=3242325 RepID=UPI002821B0E6|nr:hypothetical protein [Endomicrobium sp.]
MSKINFNKLALQAAQIAESKKAIDTVVLGVQKNNYSKLFCYNYCRVYTLNKCDM